MSEAEKNQAIIEYVQKSRFTTLSYVREDLAPVSRTIGSFASDGFDLYFSTRRTAPKVTSIQANPRASFFFEHDGQAPAEWRSVLLIGEASEATGADLERGIALLSARNPRFREKAERGDLADTLVYKLTSSEVEFLDRTQGAGFVQRVSLAD